ncbi:MAG: hypothetical protein KBD56_04765 [Candidatus Eisenbacteria bacterium]|nr:hypothetical protein [Candidatus Eisenbacteria bacterium]
MEMLRRDRRDPGRSSGLRTRLLILFLIPVMLLGLVGLLTQAAWRSDGDHGSSGVSVIFPLCFLAAILLATGLALYAGDRLARPIAWLLRAMDAGELSPPGSSERPAADWELDLLSRKVQVLLKQNLSGARAVEELENLRSEMAAILEEAAAEGLEGRGWTAKGATHPLTRRLLEYFRSRAERIRDESDGLARLQGLLEQDWREETDVIREMAARSERCFLEQTEIAMELQRLARTGMHPDGLAGKSEREGEPACEDPLTLLADLRLGIARWRIEAQEVLERALRETEMREDAAPASLPPSATSPGPTNSPASATDAKDGTFGAVRDRFSEWAQWVDESIELLENSMAGDRDGDSQTAHCLVPRLKRVSESASRAGQELGKLSREAAQLERTWERLGERLRSLMVRIGETQTEGELPVGTTREGSAGRDALQ